MKNDLKRLVRLLPIVLLLAIALVLATTPGAPIASAHTTVAASWYEKTSVSIPSTPGHVIIVSLSKQRLYAYLNGQQVFSTAVMSGRPALPTPIGTFHVFAKLSPVTFYSPFPKSSTYWYAPTHINYALE